MKKKNSYLKETRKLGLELFRSAILNNTVNEMIANFDTYSKQINFYAKLRVIKFDTSVQEGLSREEALIIVCDTDLFS